MPEKQSILLGLYKSTNLEFKNRMVMALLTRSLGTEDLIPTEIMQEYYRQRTSPDS